MIESSLGCAVIISGEIYMMLDKTLRISKAAASLFIGFS